MKKFAPVLLLTLILTIANSSIYGQEPYCEDESAYSAAYMESANTTHWSVYIPIAILVGAAIFFGVADKNQKEYSCDDSQGGGLGSMNNSKRQLSSSYPSYCKHARSSIRSRTCYNCH